MSKLTHHLQHYLPLAGVLLAGLAGFTYFSYDKSFQAVSIIASAFGYVVWGIVHHHIHGDLNFQILAEYVSVAALGVILALSILFRVGVI